MVKQNIPGQEIDNSRFLALFTLVLVAASLWIFSSYLHYILVAAALSLATSHAFIALITIMEKKWGGGWLERKKDLIASFLLTSFFLLIIFGPLLYFISITYHQANNLDIVQIKQTLLEMVDKGMHFLERIPLLQEPLTRLKHEWTSLLKGSAIELGFEWLKNIVSSAGSLFIQIVWILIFYFLFNFYGKSILTFLFSLLPLSRKEAEFLYQECTGTVAVVFYGTIFNMVAQGIAFGLFMFFIGGYNAVYLGVFAGFCSVIPIIGAALVYVPVVALELLHGHIINAVLILLFAWVVMGFLIDNFLRLFFIGFLKKTFGFTYKMNEILILLAILSGIAAFGFWGLVIGPSVLALTIAAANLYSSHMQKAYDTTRNTSSETTSEISDLLEDKKQQDIKITT